MGTEGCIMKTKTNTKKTVPSGRKSITQKAGHIKTATKRLSSKTGGIPKSKRTNLRSNKMKMFAILVVAVAVIVIVFVGYYSAVHKGDIAESGFTPVPLGTVDQAQGGGTPAPKTTEDPHPHFKDGTYKVGSDIQPGTYRTRISSDGCYWERMADFTGGLDSILANENTDAPAVVTILPTDVGFSSTRCGTWTQDLSAIISSQTFGDGTYIVGTDIQPGTYRSSGQSGCYWERMADFTGGMKSILANDNTDTSTIVTILESDKGFSSTRCGTWAKQ
jgi:hypothetical protein